MEKKINISEFEDKIAKNGKPYTRFKTAEGWITCFNKATIDKLKTKIQRNIVVNVFTSQKEGFEPSELIAVFVKDLDEAEIVDLAKTVKIEKDKKSLAMIDEKENRQWALIAKEIFLAMYMNDNQADLSKAIEITKKLRDEFK